MKQTIVWLKRYNRTPYSGFLTSIPFLLLSIAWFAAVCLIHERGPLGGDFYQIWLGARTLLDHVDPYGTTVQQAMRQVYGFWGQHGLPYPLPALLATVPFALLPLPLAMYLWTAVCTIGVCTVVALRPDWRQQFSIPLVFLPLIRTTDLMQPTLMWVALSVLFILALQRRWSIIAGLCFALLPAKPQTGLVIACAGFLWALRNQRAAALWGVVWGVGIWGSSFVLAPHWVQECMTAIIRYRTLYTAPSFLPFGLLVVVCSYRQPWWATAAVLQVVLFPFHDLYGTLPMIIAWVGIGGPIAWIGAGISWMWLFSGNLNFIVKIWLFMFLPYATLAVWSTRSFWLAGRLQKHLPAESAA